jgi:hypothetical protein
MSPRELGITYLGAVLGELFCYLTMPPDEPDCEASYRVLAREAEQGRWAGHRDLAASGLAAEILGHAELDGVKLDGNTLACLLPVLACSTEIVLCYVDATD